MAALALAIAAAAPPRPADAAGRPSCRPAGSKTIVQTERARVFRWRRLVYGCLFKRRIAVALTSDDGYGTTELLPPTPRLAGRFVAHAYRWVGAAEGGGYGIQVVDLRTGADNIAEFDQTLDDTPAGAQVRKIILTRDGFVAWGWTIETGDGAFLGEIRRLRPGQNDYRLERKPLDVGPEVDPASLRRSDRTIFWRTGSEERSAQLR